ncbi:hypothetical protein [Mycobacterium colombiense]|uniref:hypothetical protein n=2 Tax=Mycobacterium colombiense TaxID=339268 RepID=UPI001E54B2D0|nr:hypothetical protein [Mycobacterium colombiense]
MPTDHRDNPPPYGRLPGGMKLTDVVTAIEMSGYPLQADVANTLSGVVEDHPRLMPTYQEEWAYVDSDSGEVRSIDIFAELQYFKRLDRRTGQEIDTDQQVDDLDVEYEYGSALNLFVECKQSEMPYIFFLREQPPSHSHNFPDFAGILTPEICLYHRDPGEDLSDFAYYMSAHDIIGLYDLPFFRSPENYAVSISKVARSGSKIMLTGEEAYRSLTLPLIKAADHFKRLRAPAAETDDGEGDTSYSRIHFVICLAVLRAPMLGSNLRDGELQLIPIPWARAWRLEPTPQGEEAIWPGLVSTTIRYMDVVHESFLSEYLDKLISDFGLASERLMEDLHIVITDGRGVSETSIKPDAEPYETIRSLTPEEKERLDQGEPKDAAKIHISRTT